MTASQAQETTAVYCDLTGTESDAGSWVACFIVIAALVSNGGSHSRE